jgi:4-coumarate--CoA ligase
MISHQNVIAQCLQITAVLAPSPSLPRKVLALLPAFHITGLVHLLHLPIHLNAEVYMLPSFTMPGMLSVVSEYKIPELLLVPPIIIRLVRDPIVDEYDLSHVTAFSSGAAPLSAEILELLKKKFPNTGFKQGYGMTESCSCLTAHPSDMYSYEYAHKVGTICASTEIKILDEDGKELSYDQPGEIWGKGPQVTMGYLDNEEATRSTYVDGWLRTGDQGMIGRDGMVMITDRIKEMIKVKGIAVAPAELEDLLLGHEFVEDVAVLGIPDEWSGEKPKAFVVRKAGVGGKGGREIGERELGGLLMEYVKERKVRTKWIKEVEFINEIPKSASGKILRRVLRDLHRGKGEGDRGTIVRDEVTEKAKL